MDGSAPDPTATWKSEELTYALENSIVTVTRDMQQAARVSDYTAFFAMGQRRNTKIFTNPREERMEAYITGRFG